MSSLNNIANSLKVLNQQSEIIANNIAQSQTTGFKEVYGFTVDEGPDTGVSLHSMSDITKSGSLQATDSALDLTISGNGWLTFQDEMGVPYYVQTVRGYLEGRDKIFRDSAGGGRLQVYAADSQGNIPDNPTSLSDLTIPLGEVNPLEPTTAITVNSQLSQSTQVTGPQSMVMGVPIGNPASTVTDIIAPTSALPNGSTLTFSSIVDSAGENKAVSGSANIEETKFVFSALQSSPYTSTDKAIQDKVIEALTPIPSIPLPIPLPSPIAADDKIAITYQDSTGYTATQYISASSLFCTNDDLFIPCIVDPITTNVTDGKIVSAIQQSLQNLGMRTTTYTQSSSSSLVIAPPATDANNFKFTITADSSSPASAAILEALGFAAPTNAPGGLGPNNSMTVSSTGGTSFSSLEDLGSRIQEISTKTASPLAMMQPASWQSGNIIVLQGTASGGRYNIQFTSPNSGVLQALGLSVPAVSTYDPYDSGHNIASLSVKSDVVDSTAIYNPTNEAQSISFAYKKVSSTSWAVEAYNSNPYASNINKLAGVGLLELNDDGSFKKIDTFTPARYSIDVPDPFASLDSFPKLSSLQNNALFTIGVTIPSVATKSFSYAYSTTVPANMSGGTDTPAQFNSLGQLVQLLNNDFAIHNLRLTASLDRQQNGGASNYRLVVYNLDNNQELSFGGAVNQLLQVAPSSLYNSVSDLGTEPLIVSPIGNSSAPVEDQNIITITWSGGTTSGSSTVTLNQNGLPEGIVTDFYQDSGNFYTLDNHGNKSLIARLALATFNNPRVLTFGTGGGYVPNQESGPAQYSWIGHNTTSEARSYLLADSTVNVTDEMVNLTETNQLYGANIAALETEQKMWDRLLNATT